MLPWLLCGAIFLLLLIVCLRLWSLRRALGELAGQLSYVLSEDTNVRLSLSTRDRYARKLAAELSRELSELRRLRWKYQNGDRELKEAVTNISHDLRTPLTAVCGYLELLEREDKSEAVERYLACIGERAEAMRRLTEELFCYSVVLSPETAPELVRGDLRAALESSLAGAFPALSERGISPVVELPEEPVFCLMSRPSPAFSATCSPTPSNTPGATCASAWAITPWSSLKTPRPGSTRSRSASSLTASTPSRLRAAPPASASPSPKRSWNRCAAASPPNSRTACSGSA